MLQATVVGHVWATKRIDGLPNGAFLEVEVEGSGDRLVAFDVLGSGHGERVLIAQGSVASGWLPDRPPVDALIIGSIDEPTAGPPADRATRPRPGRVGQPRGPRHSGRPKTSR
jgi:ethanolamine utilization protein EutN